MADDEDRRRVLAAMLPRMPTAMPGTTPMPWDMPSRSAPAEPTGFPELKRPPSLPPLPLGEQDWGRIPSDYPEAEPEPTFEPRIPEGFVGVVAQPDDRVLRVSKAGVRSVPVEEPTVTFLNEESVARLGVESPPEEYAGYPFAEVDWRKYLPTAKEATFGDYVRRQQGDLPRRATLDAISILRAGEFLGSPFDGVPHAESSDLSSASTRRQLRGVPFLMLPTASEASPEEMQLRKGDYRPGVLHPLVGTLAWGAGNENNWDAVPRGVRALVSVSLGKGTPGPTGQLEERGTGGDLRGLDFNELKKLAGGNAPWISLRKSLLLTALATRAAEAEPNDRKLRANLETLLSTETVRKVLWAAEPDAAAVGPDKESALAHAWTQVSLELKEIKAGLDQEDAGSLARGLNVGITSRLLKLELDEKGYVLPMTAGENPRHWMEASARWSEWEFEREVRKAHGRGDDLLALELQRQMSERFIHPGFERGEDFGRAVWRIGKSGAQIGLAPMALAFGGISAVTSLFAEAGVALVEPSHRALMHLDNKMTGTREAMFKSAGAMLMALPEDIRTLARIAAPRSWGAKIVPYADFARVTTEWEYMPARPLIAAIGTASVLVKGSAAMLYGVTSRNASILSRLAEGWAVGTEGWRAATSLGNAIKGAGHAADVAGSWYRARTVAKAGERLAEVGKELATENISSLAQLNKKMTTLAAQEGKLAQAFRKGDAAAAVQLEAVQTQLAALGVLQDAVALSMRDLGIAAGAPKVGRFIRKWFLAPSAQRFPPIAQKLIDAMKGMDKGGVLQMFGRLEATLGDLQRLGVPSGSAAAATIAMLEGIGDVGAMVEWTFDKGYGAIGKRVVEATKGETFKIGARTYDMATEAVAAAKAGRTVEDHLGELAAAHLRNTAALKLSPNKAAEQILAYAHANDLTRGQAMFQWFQNHVFEQEQAGALELPNIPGQTPEATRFAMALEFAVPEGGAVSTLGGDTFKFGAFYDDLVDRSPMLRLLPQNERAAAALEVLRHVRPKLYGVPAFEGKIAFAKGDKLRYAQLSQETVLKTMGARVQDIGEFAFQTGVDLVEAGIMPIESLKEFGLSWWHRQFKGFKGRELKTQLIKFEKGGGKEGRQLRKQVVGEVQASRRRYLPDEEQNLTMVSGAILGRASSLLKGREVFTGAKFRTADVGQTARVSGKVGRELHRELYQTSPESILETLSNMHTLRSYAQTVRVLRAEGMKFARHLDEVLSSGKLSDDTISMLAGKGTSVDVTNVGSRVNGAVRLLEGADVVTLTPQTMAMIGSTLKTAGWTSMKELHGKLWGATSEQQWQSSVMVSPEVAYVFDFYGRVQGKPRGFWDKTIRAIKGNQIVARPGPWFRDYTSNIFVLGPVNGLWPWSPGWKLAPRLLETPNALGDMMSVAGMGRSTIGAELAQSVGPEMAGSLLGQMFGLAREGAKNVAAYGHPSRWLEAIPALAEWTARAAVHPTSLPSGKWLQAQRGMTDMLPRAALFAEEVMGAGVKAGIDIRGLVLKAAEREGVRIGRSRPRAMQGVPHGKGQTYGALSMLDDLASAVRKRAQREAKTRGWKGGHAAYFVRTETGRAIGAPFNEIIPRLGENGMHSIIEKVKTSFVDYADKSKFLDAVTRSPFGPIYATFSIKAIPMVARWMTERPVTSYAMLGVWDSMVTMINYASGNEISAEEFRRQAQDWQVPFPTGASEIWRVGNVHEWKGGVGLDLAWNSPLTFGLTQLHPAFSPLGATALQLAQLADKGKTPISNFPPGNYAPGGGLRQFILPPLGGEPLADALTGPTEQLVQTVNSVMSQFLPASGSIGWGLAQKGLNAVISGITGTDFTLGPGGPGVAMEATGRGLAEASTSARKRTTPLPAGLSWAALRTLGMKPVPIDAPLQQMTGSIKMREAEVREKAEAQRYAAQAQGADLSTLPPIQAVSKSPFDYTLNSVNEA